MSFEKWIILKEASCGKYIYAVVPNHPKAIDHGYVLKHRVLMENLIGRLLTDDEVVHHKNGNSRDNRIENLEIMDRIKHNEYHGSKKDKLFCKLKCPNCNKIFVRSRHKTFLSKGGKYNCCSNHCRGVFSRNIQLHGMTDTNTRAIKENIVEIFSKNGQEEIEDTGINDTLYKGDKSFRLSKEGEMLTSKQDVIIKCKKCGKELVTKNTEQQYCSYECSSLSSRKVERPSSEELHTLVWSMSTVKVAEIFGVSDKAVEKWCKSLGVEKPPRGYWAKKAAGKI